MKITPMILYNSADQICFLQRIGRASVFGSLLALPLFTLATAASAGTGSGPASGLIGQYNGVFFFNTEQSRQAAPSCASTNPKRWVINSSTGAGQAIISEVMLAYSSNKSVTVVGTGDCGLGYDTESVAFVILP